MNPIAPQAQQVFAEAVLLSDPAKRRAFLDRVCAVNTALREEVESLLRAHEGAGNFLAQTVKLTESDFAIEPTGMMIGRYKLLEKIGEGGFGVVYLAEQVEPVHRKVALKVIKAGMDTKEVIARFEAERKATIILVEPSTHTKTNWGFRVAIDSGSSNALPLQSRQYIATYETEN